MQLDDFLAIQPYSLLHDEKEKMLLAYFKELTQYHQEHCTIYSNILKASHFDMESVQNVSDVPFLPVSLFKDCELMSVPREQITKIMTSSGTTGQKVSKVFLDAQTSKDQTKVLSKIITSYIGSKRLPLLILDSALALRDRRLFSARGAGIMGFSVFGRDTAYALDKDMNLDIEAVEAFLAKHKGEPILMFGYTFMIWKHFYLELKNRGIKLDFGKDAVLFHVGGWKKLKEMAVDGETYRNSLLEQCGIPKVYDYYGMAEQLGSIFVACEHGHLHASVFSEVIPRRHEDFSPCEVGETGILQVMSVIPRSYPGHSLLTEDEGVILGIDDCPCGRKGKYFAIHGRLKNAEIRGCSDTYAAKF